MVRQNLHAEGENEPKRKRIRIERLSLVIESKDYIEIMFWTIVFAIDDVRP